MKKPRIKSSKVVASSRLFDVEAMQLEFSNGEQREYERIVGRAPAAVMIAPLLDRDTILLIREYAGGMQDYVLGFPKGAVGKNEDLLETANRELQEETGYAAKQLEHVCQFSASPGYVAAIMQLVIAKDLYPSSLPGDEPEPIEVIEWKLDDVDALLAHPEFYEARSIATLLLLERQRHG